MPRASWKGFLRLSLVSCPVYLSPATTRTKSIRLHQVWVPSARQAEPSEAEDEEAPPRAAGRSSRGEPTPRRMSGTNPQDQQRGSRFNPLRATAARLLSATRSSKATSSSADSL
jgi:hypothetical protein